MREVLARAVDVFDSTWQFTQRRDHRRLEPRVDELLTCPPLRQVPHVLHEPVDETQRLACVRHRVLKHLGCEVELVSHVLKGYVDSLVHCLHRLTLRLPPAVIHRVRIPRQVGGPCRLDPMLDE